MPGYTLGSRGAALSHCLPFTPRESPYGAPRALGCPVFSGPGITYHLCGHGEAAMPTVGKKKFGYGKSGKAAARKFAKATGKPVRKSRTTGGKKRARKAR